MIRHSPGEFYLKYLLVHPKGYSNEDVLEDIAPDLGLDTLGEWYLNKLRRECIPPIPFYPFDDPEHLPSYRFMRVQQIRQAFNPSPDMQQAIKILRKPKIRELVEVMILSGAPDEAIEFALQIKKGFPCGRYTVKYYRHYFWNIELLDTTDLRALLDMRFENVLDREDPLIKAQFGALHRAKYSDSRVSAARLPSSPLTAILSQMQMGVMPSGINLAEVVEQTRMAATLRTLDAAMMGGPKGAEMAQKYAVTADVMNRMMETVVKPEEQLREDLARIAMATDDSKPPVIGELTQGSHTTELEPEPEPDEEEYDDDEPELVSG